MSRLYQPRREIRSNVTTTTNNDNSHSSNGRHPAFAVLPFEHFIGVGVVGKGFRLRIKKIGATSSSSTICRAFDRPAVSTTLESGELSSGHSAIRYPISECPIAWGDWYVRLPCYRPLAPVDSQTATRSPEECCRPIRIGEQWSTAELSVIPCALRL